jgi:hypothetical protein
MSPIGTLLALVILRTARQGGEIMAKQILVALKNQDRLEQMVPYIEELAQPGTEVIFLVRFAPKAEVKGSRDNCLTLKPLEEVRFAEDREAPRLMDRKIIGTQGIEGQRLSAEHKVFLALEALVKRGVEIAVDVYMGSLRRVVKSYTRKGDVRLIVMRTRWDLTLMRFLHRTFAAFGLLKQPTFSPVLLLHPEHGM